MNNINFLKHVFIKLKSSEIDFERQSITTDEAMKKSKIDQERMNGEYIKLKKENDEFFEMFK
ncbi:hypothetical protein [Nicoliella lavandulae]|uniref:Uncharacterized protein n=1 Tax=Nicoliella lavandulae TaxID=3082954 RepID=A0ABU8SN56_9LACO